MHTGECSLTKRANYTRVSGVCWGHLILSCSCYHAASWADCFGGCGRSLAVDRSTYLHRYCIIVTSVGLFLQKTNKSACKWCWKQALRSLTYMHTTCKVWSTAKVNKSTTLIQICKYNEQNAIKAKEVQKSIISYHVARFSVICSSGKRSLHFLFLLQFIFVNNILVWVCHW